YWDPIAAHRVWQTAIPLLLCPLDVTNSVPVTADFMRQISRQRRYPLSDFVGQCYALIMDQPYCFWDVLTTTYLGRPDLFEVGEWETIVITAGPSQGRIKVQPGGRPIQALHKVDLAGFHAYILQQWAR
ncbi:MAG: nucleoside hydrolase, partial [Anaerolineae bacterium]